LYFIINFIYIILPFLLVARNRKSLSVSHELRLLQQKINQLTVFLFILSLSLKLAKSRLKLDDNK